MGVALVFGLLLAVPAAADQTIEAAATIRYVNPNITIAQGEKVNFANNDSVQHDVSSVGDTADHKPLFESQLIGRGQTSAVDGTQYLKTGKYDFYCSVHPQQMKGTITVTSAGTPEHRPGDPYPATLKVSSAKLSSLKKLTVKVGGTPGKKATVTATAKGLKLGSKSAKIGSGGSSKVSITLTSSARKKIAKLKKLTVTFKVKTTDGQSAKATHTYK
jgi:plastocyanin